MVEVGEWIFEVLETEDIDEWERGFDNCDGERGVGFVAVAEDEVVRVVAPNGGVRDLVVASREFSQLGSAGVGGEPLRVEKWALPFVAAAGVHPHRAVGVE